MIFKLGLYGIYPSIQPSHAVSDYRWQKKLGKRELKMPCYKNFRECWNNHYGTDFPIEARIL